MAARGTRNMDTGEESINDAHLIVELRRRAHRIHFRALITALAITLLTFAFPKIS